MTTAATAAEIVLDSPSPLATATEIVRRTQTPITFDRFLRYRAERGVVVDEHAVDLADETFDVHLPRHAPAGGRYALLVWVSPHDRMPAPRAWRAALDRHGMIVVSARASGNDHGSLERRMPLALHAAHGVQQRYDIDPARVYVGGFSGGARVALRLAAGYPEVFRGAMLAAGSDEIGGKLMSPPPAAQLALLQQRSRLVWVTGAGDLPNRRMAAISRDAMLAHCVTQIHDLLMARAGHEPPDRRSFARALALLDPLKGATAPDEDAVAACRAGLAAEAEAALAEVDTMIAAGEFEAAGDRLAAIDLRWGGLAAPRSVELARYLAERRDSRATDSPD